MLFLLFFITPILGALKNIVKYKKFNFLLFISSPMLTYLIYLICKYNILLSFILERWFMFIYKIFRAYIDPNSDYAKPNKKAKFLQLLASTKGQGNDDSTYWSDTFGDFEGLIKSTIGQIGRAHV